MLVQVAVSQAHRLSLSGLERSACHMGVPGKWKQGLVAIPQLRPRLLPGLSSLLCGGR